MMLLIYIVRHGKAEGGSSSGIDRDRILTPKGHRQAQAAGAYLAECDTPPMLVIGSPYARANATAQEIAGLLGLRVELDDRLGCDAGLTEMLAVINDHQNMDAIAIVGHMPTVDRLMSLLTEGATASASALRTGEVAAVRVVGEELVGAGVLVDVFRLAKKEG